MGAIRLPRKGRWVLEKVFRIDTNPDRAAVVISSSYVKAGGPSPELKRVYKEHVAAKKAREGKNQPA